MGREKREERERQGQRNEELTSTIGVAEVGEAPHVAQTHGVAQQWHKKVKSSWPVAAIVHILWLSHQVIVEWREDCSTGHILHQAVYWILNRYSDEHV